VRLLLLVLAGCGRIGFGETTGVGPSSDAHRGSALFDGGDAAGTIDALTSPLCGATVILADDFADGVVGSGPWTQVPALATGLSEQGGTFNIAVLGNATGGQHAGLRQTASESFTGICAIAEIDTTCTGTVHSYVRLGTQTNHVEMYVANGQLYGEWTNGGTTGTNGPVAFDPVADRFLRIREQAGNYHFEMGPSLTSFPSTLGLQGGAVVMPGPSSFEIGADITATTSASTSCAFASAVLLGP